MRSPFDSPIGSRPRSMALHTGSPKSSQPESMNSTSPSTSMGPPSNNSPEVEQHASLSNGGNGHNGMPQSQTGAAAVGASQGPKVVQTAFIHKLYSMLEDKTIQHLISWSNNGDSFVMSPSNEFSKVLAQYFKHTNISSFVRQLNMYGFHKVSDVFHTGSAESALWEFRHGNNNFKKGDLLGLREIKRRASRHTLIHRDSFTNPNPTKPSQTGTPAEIAPDPDSRLAHLEAMFYDVHARLSRTEDNYALMNSRCQALAEGLTRCHSWIQNLSGALQSAVQPDTNLHSELANMQKDIARQLEYVRSLEQPVEAPVNGSGRSSYYPTNMALDPPVSPRGYGFSDSRRSSIQMQEPPPFGGRPPVPPIPPQFSSSSPRRYGSISGAPQTSPSFSRPALPGPSQPHPLSNVVSPPANLARRHTSADIREHGWPVPNTNGSPYASGDNSVQWQPSSPQQPPNTSDQQLQDQLARYEINGSRRPTITAADQDVVPPAHRENPPSGLGVGNVSWGAGAPKFPRPNFELHSAPATRRSSMASNVHSLLNPADTAEQANEDEGLNDDRKRKRLG